MLADITVIATSMKSMLHVLNHFNRLSMGGKNKHLLSLRVEFKVESTRARQFFSANQISKHGIVFMDSIVSFTDKVRYASYWVLSLWRTWVQSPPCSSSLTVLIVQWSRSWRADSRGPLVIQASSCKSVPSHNGHFASSTNLF